MHTQHTDTIAYFISSAQKFIKSEFQVKGKWKHTKTLNIFFNIIIEVIYLRVTY